MVGHGPRAEGEGDLSGRLVRVLTTVSVTEGLLARGILEAEGVPVLTKGEGEGPYRLGPVQLWVPEEFEVQARLVLEGFPVGGESPTAEREADRPADDVD
jgi:Putative prokaryotic signal transducing protein